MIEINSTKPNEWVKGLPQEKYHDDKTTVSSSALRLLHMESEAHFKSRFFDGDEVKESKPMKLGTLIHKAILEGTEFTSKYIVEPKFEGLTQDGKMSSQSKAAKEKRELWRAENFDKIIVTQEERDMIFGIIDSVMKHQDAMEFIRGCDTEVSGYYTDPGTGIRCRIRPDYKNSTDGILGDVKSVRSCKKDDFMWQMIRMGWDFQLAMYTEGMGIIDGKEPFVSQFLAVEKVKPYACAVYILDIGSVDWAQTNYRKALLKLKHCLTTNVWRPYQERYETLSIPEKLMEQSKFEQEPHEEDPDFDDEMNYGGEE